MYLPTYILNIYFSTQIYYFELKFHICRMGCGVPISRSRASTEIDGLSELSLSSKHKNDSGTRTSEVQPSHLRHEVPRRSMEGLEEQIKATIYGQCIGDAIGLLTEFMSKTVVRKHYGKLRELEFSHKVSDGHRDRWDVGDWTDDSDHMILIMQSLTDMRGKVSPVDFAKKLYDWSQKGFVELGDRVGMGLGRTTHEILSQRKYVSNPQETAKDIWIKRGRTDAPNGAVMRTSILGIHEWWDVAKVAKNAAVICQASHYDPRCQASAVAVSVAISIMFQKKKQHYDDKARRYDVKRIITDAYSLASKYVDEETVKPELLWYMSCTDIRSLKLDDEDTMGYTFKCLGAGFWALKQNDFRTAIEQLVREGGDADTNCAVAGALLGCKISTRKAFPETWFSDLANRMWLREQIQRYIDIHNRMYCDALNDQGSRHPLGSQY
ncbi:hypothetical protein ACJMK2_041375 [Sinanodonta woodiana]|uniref:Uncharacterized protein n=1 Tax=Sinanodonta woodiana TaxID=1069815 RepID=A0ABD3W420_SINWO